MWAGDGLSVCLSKYGIVKTVTLKYLLKAEFGIDLYIPKPEPKQRPKSKPKRKIYCCTICKKILEDEMPIRIVIQEYGAGKYKQYYPIEHFDLCKKCYESKRSAKDEMYNVQ